MRYVRTPSTFSEMILWSSPRMLMHSRVVWGSQSNFLINSGSVAPLALPRYEGNHRRTFGTALAVANFFQAKKPRLRAGRALAPAAHTPAPEGALSKRREGRHFRNLLSPIPSNRRGPENMNALPDIMHAAPGRTGDHEPKGRVHWCRNAVARAHHHQRRADL
jgi:hypothetical protein